jgi:hypothetical protein
MTNTHWMARGLATAALVLTAAACGGKKGDSTPRPQGLTISEQGLGGITAKTPVVPSTLQQMFPDYEIRPDPENEDVLELFKDGERHFYVVAAITPRPEEGVFNVQVTSAKIPGPNGWVVGAPLASTANLDMCECWSDLRVCYQRGTQLAVAIDHNDCEDLPGLGNTIIGKPIARLIWNPLPWPEKAYTGEDDMEDGGDWGDEGDGELEE